MYYKPNSKILMIAIFSFSFMFSCGIKEEYRDLQNTVAEVEKTADHLTTEDWQKYDQEIEQTKEKLKTERDSYTPEEKEKMNKLIGKYYALKAKHKVGSLKQELQDATQQLKGAYEAIFNETEEIITKQS